MKTALESHNLRGAVKSVTIDTTRFVDEDGRLVEQAWHSRELAFDPTGNLVEQIFRNSDGSTYRTVDDHADDGRPLGTRGYDASGRLSYEVHRIYDVDGNLVAERQVEADGSETEPTVYSYDERGRKRKTQTFEHAADGSVMFMIEDADFGIGAGAARSIETRYDGRDLAAEVIMRDASGATVSRVEIRRDEHGEVLTVTRFNGDVLPFGAGLAAVLTQEGQEPLTPEQRAEMGAELQRLFAPGTPASVQTYAYDDERRRIGSTMTMMGMVADRRTFAYDDRGDKIEEASYDPGGRLQSRATFAREYDARGNWITEVVSSASGADAALATPTPQHATRRTITYY